MTQASGDYQISLEPGNNITDLAGNALAIGNTESWLTGYTSDAMASFGFIAGKKGLKIHDRFAQYHQFIQFIQLVQVGANTEVQVDKDGKGAGTAFTTLVTLQNVVASSVQSTNFVVG